MGSDTAYVKALYTNMLMRTASQKEVDQWVGRLKASGSKRWSRAKVAAQFATSNEAIRKNDARWTAWVANAPTVAVVQTAAKAQRSRYDAMQSEYQRPAKRSMEAAQAAAKSAQNQVTAAAAIASKKNPSAGDLQDIAKQQAAAQAQESIARSKANDAENKVKGAAKNYEKSLALARYATDIGQNKDYGISKIKKRYDETKYFAGVAGAKYKDIKGMIGKIANSYKVAEKKYEAAALAANTTPNGGTCPPSECVVPPAKTGETPEQGDKRVGDFCNSLKDTQKALYGGQTGIARATRVVGVFDNYYVNDGSHRRSCDQKFKSYLLGTLVCASGYHPDGPACLPINTAAPAVPIQANPTSKQCPKGFFAAKGYCWNGTVTKYVKLEEKCPGSSVFYTSKMLGGLRYQECRTRKNQYAGYFY